MADIEVTEAPVEVPEAPVEASEAPEAAPAAVFDDSYDEALLIKVKGKVRVLEPMGPGRLGTPSSLLTLRFAAGEAACQAR